MSTRKSGRATKAVKYTSASEGSDFEDAKKRKNTNTKKAAEKAEGEATNKKISTTTKKRPVERSSCPSEETTTATTATNPAPKRQKKCPAPTPNTTQPPAHPSKPDKAAAKKTWQDYLSSHSADGALLDTEPDKTISITQTDALKKYGLKKEELVPLRCWEKKNPLYGGVMRIFVEEEVRALGERKVGILGGGGGEGDKGKVENGGDEGEKEKGKGGTDDEHLLEKAPEKKKDKVKTPKQKWSAYITAQSLGDDDKLNEEPSDPISQTDSKKKYNLTPQDLGCLPHFPRKNAAYGKTLKLFNASEVRTLAFRKMAVLAGVEDGNGEDLLKAGKELFEGKEDGDIK